MFIFWSGCALISSVLEKYFSLSFTLSDAFDPRLANLSHSNGTEDVNYESYANFLSIYASFGFGMISLCYIYLICLVLFRFNTLESTHRWYQLYNDIIPIEIYAVGMLGLGRAFTVMITYGASFSVPGGSTATRAQWANISGHYYFASFILTSHTFINAMHYSYSKYEEYVRGKLFDDKINLNNKVYIVTGSNTGLGYHTAKELVEMGGTVIMACRTLSKANESRLKILKSLPKISPSKLIVLQLDLNSFQSVKKFVKLFLELNLPLNCLINNAGLMTSERYVTDDDPNLESVMTANHLSHFLLSNLLLPVMNKTSHNNLEKLIEKKKIILEKEKKLNSNINTKNKKVN